MPRVLSLSDSNTCQVMNQNGRLICWGNGILNITTVPKQFKQHTDHVVVGQQHACAIQHYQSGRKEIQNAICWGQNHSGGMDLEDKWVYVFLDIGAGFTCVLYKVDLEGTRQTRFKCYGKYVQSISQHELNEFKIKIPVDLEEGVTFFSSKQSHALLIKFKLYCIGTNTFGECDIPEVMNDEKQAVPNPIQPELATLIHSVSTGQNHSCSISMQTVLLCWGKNNAAQASTPVLLHKQLWYGVFSGYAHNCLLLMSGVHCWGDNTYHQATGVTLLSGDITELASGGWHNCTTEHKMESGGTEHEHFECWGRNQHHQCDMPRKGGNLEY